MLYLFLIDNTKKHHTVTAVKVQQALAGHCDDWTAVRSVEMRHTASMKWMKS